ncbi:MAG: hypothetical protein J0I12_15315 [Candidatus Eremiobacteraeota bacterium]|nr:hypothetical protein [Candidatus Eremiobacteraeota bacterium]
MIRPHEWPKVRFLLGLILIGWTGLSIAMVVTDTLLLSSLGVHYLPIALLLTSGLTLSSSLGYTALLSRYHSLQLLQATFLMVGGLLLAGFCGLKAGASWLCLPLLALYGTSFSLIATQSFGLASECIDTYSSKRLFPVLTVGATCGELLGGLLVAGGARRVDPSGWVLVWGLTNFLALAWLWAHRQPLQQWRQTRRQKPAPVPYLRRDPLVRSLVLLLLGMVLCQGTSQYLFSQIFAAAYPQPRDLARFLGLLISLTNLAELVIATQLTPRLVGWLGVARAGWLHPTLMLSGLLGISLRFQLGPAIWLWICRRTMQDSLATPVRNLLYNAIPARVRPALRAFLDGVVVSCAQACVALLLLFLQHRLQPVQIAYAGIGLALVYAAGARGASRNYLRTLLGELQSEGLVLKARTTASFQDGAQPGDPLALQSRAQSLASADAKLRLEAAAQLAGRGADGVRAALPYLFSDQCSTVEAALRVLGQSPTPWARSLLQDQFASRSRAAAQAWVAAHKQPAESLRSRFLKEARHQESLRHQRLAFCALRWLEGEELVETVRLSLLSQGGRSANALEVLSNLGERQPTQLFVNLLEPNSDEERARLLSGPETDGTLSEDRWVRWAATRAGSPPAWELARMEQLLTLRRTHPFHRMDLAQLEILRLRMIEERFATGRVFWQAGQSLERALVPLEGELTRGFWGGVELAGQMTARSALVTAGPVRVLSLSAAAWEVSLRDLPALSTGTFQWLSAELRRTEKDGSEHRRP